MSKEERPPHTRVSNWDKLTLLALGAGAFVVGGSFAWVSVGSGSQTSRSAYTKAIKEAKTQYMETFKQASPTKKYAMDFLSGQSIFIPPYSPDSPSQNYLVVNFNNSCLKNSAFDIQSEAGSPAATPKINPNNPNQLVIESGGPNSVNLVLNGLKNGDALTPADVQTSTILTTYGCKTGLIHSTSSNLNG